MRLKGNWDLYDVFFWVSMCGSFYSAQGLLNRSRSTIMRQINKLEEVLEIKLFRRSYDGVELTPDGEMLFDAVRKSRQDLINAENALRKKAIGNR